MIFRYIFSLVLLFYAFTVSASSLKGKVIDDQKLPIEYFTVAIISPHDSSIIIGGAFMDGYFEINNIKENKCVVRISCVGYQTRTQSIDFTKNTLIDLGVIPLKSLELKEVVVRAKRPVFKQTEGRLVVDVKGTSLSEAGNLFDVLKRSPGLIVENENKITVFGKGTPLIFINNREVKNNAEIESLQSDDILNIEIDRNPSAEYSAEGNAVIQIKTKKITNDKINLQIFNRSYFARRFSTVNGIQLNSKIKKTTATINYLYNYSKSKNYEDAYETNDQSNYTISNNNFTVRYPKSKKHNLFASINQELNCKNNIGFQYSYISSSQNQNSKSRQIILKTTDVETRRNILKNNDGSNDLYIFNLNYKYDIDSISFLSIIGDITKSSNYIIENINEIDITNNSSLRSLIESKNEYDIYSGKIDLKTCFLQLINLKSGIKVSNVTNDGILNSTNLNTLTNNYQIKDKINDRIYSAYLSVRPNFENFTLKAGLRYEYTDTDIDSNNEIVLDSTYGGWFPSVLLNKEFSKNLDITFSYSKKIDRPAFNELSTDITYFNSLAYSIGNPEIKPTISHNLDLTFELFNNLSVNFSYSYDKNARVMGAVNDEKNKDIVKYTPVNIMKAEYFYTNIDYNYLCKFLSCTFSLGGEKPFIEIPYLKSYQKIRKFSWYFQINNDFSLSNRTSLFANYRYNSRRKDLMTHFDSRYKLSLGVNTSFFEKNLKLSIMANDIFNTSDNSWKDKYRNIIAGSDPDYDNTWIRFSIKYSFNDFRGGVRKKSASASELNRL